MKPADSTFRRCAPPCFAILAAAAIAITAPAATALADAVTTGTDGARSVRVRIDDLDLATQRGNVVLYDRIKSAARRVCPDVSVKDLSMMAAAEKCRSEAISRAVRGLNNPQLAAIHAAHPPRG